MEEAIRRRDARAELVRLRVRRDLKAIYSVTQSSFTVLGLAAPLCRALEEAHYTAPTPIQSQAIPVLLRGQDLIGIAQTGTGKTAAFALPVLQRLTENPAPRRARGLRALVLAPTRELAIQIDEAFATYGRHLDLRRAVVIGGVGQGRQVDALRRGTDILVATPGRLLDLVGQGHVDLGGATTVVLDEADRMLDMGFVRDVRKIVGMLPKARQSMLFSATMPDAVAKLAQSFLRDPARVDVTPAQRTVERIDQNVYFVDGAGKRGLLGRLLRDPAFARVIVFTRTKRGANRVAEQLDAAGIAAEALHGNKSQNARVRALESFRSGRARVLVATDIAARGIDVDDVTHVINYELPEVAESYVHRVGRTARAGAGGIAISFCDAAEMPLLRDIERFTRQRLAVVKDETFRANAVPANDDAGRPRQKPQNTRRRRRARPGRRAKAA